MKNKTKKTPKFYLKDRLFNQEKVTRVASEIKRVHLEFNDTRFIKDVLQKFPELELKARTSHVGEMLRHYLPSDYNEALNIILEALPPLLDESKTDGDYGDFVYGSYSEFVSRYGIDKNNLDVSLEALSEITKRFSAEYAIRHFINTHKDYTLNKITGWSKNENYHVRRLASEGTRPRLPWGVKVNLDYKETEQILDNLFHDRTRYVTRSVANHLNDISKIDEDFVRCKLEEWKKSGKQTESEMNFIIKHSLRTLNKRARLNKSTS